MADVVRSQGGVYGQHAQLPFASGWLAPSNDQVRIASTRAIYLSTGSGSDPDAYVEFADGPGQFFKLENLPSNSDILLPFSITAVSSVQNLTMFGLY